MLAWHWTNLSKCFQYIELLDLISAICVGFDGSFFSIQWVVLGMDGNCSAFHSMFTLLHNISYLQMKKLLLVIDIAVNGLWSFMWFVTFIYTADQWRKTNRNGFSTSSTNCANSGVAFSFFSILLWVSLLLKFGVHGQARRAFLFECHLSVLPMSGGGVHSLGHVCFNFRSA